MEILREKLHLDYTDVLLDHPDSPLVAAQHVIQEFLEFHRQVVTESSKQVAAPAEEADARSYRNTELLSPKRRRQVFQVMENYLRPRIMDVSYYGESMTPQATAQLITWLEQACFAPLQAQCPELLITSAWHRDVDDLCEHYLERAVRRELRELVQRSASLLCDNSDDLRRNQQGHVVSGHPERIVFMIQSQLSVAQDILPSKYTAVVLRACHEELSRLVVADLMLQIGTQWHSMGSSQFCAIINDAFRLSELMDDVNSEYLSSAESSQENHGEALLSDLAELSMHALTFLCQRILLDLREPTPILTSVGSAAWQKEEPTQQAAMERTVATLRDYLGDIQQGLVSDYYFPKILKTMVDLVLQMYVESFFANTMAKEARPDPLATARALRRDYTCLATFFNEDLLFVDYFQRGGFYSKDEISTRLGIIQSLSSLMDPTNAPEELQEHVQNVLQCFGPYNGAPAVLHLAGLRRRYNASEKSVEWLRLIARAQQQQPAAPPTTAILGCQLPDLRNSPHIQKLVLDPQEVTRRISQRSLSLAQKTSRLLAKPKTGNPLRAIANRFGMRLDDV